MLFLFYLSPPPLPQPSSQKTFPRALLVSYVYCAQETNWAHILHRWASFHGPGFHKVLSQLLPLLKLAPLQKSLRTFRQRSVIKVFMQFGWSWGGIRGSEVRSFLPLASTQWKRQHVWVFKPQTIINSLFQWKMSSWEFHPLDMAVRSASFSLHFLKLCTCKHGPTLKPTWLPCHSCATVVTKP